MELENNMKAALADIDSFQTADCLDTEIIDLYVENRLDDSEREIVEKHLHTCLYCLKQLNDMTALLHFQKQAAVNQHKKQQSQTTAPSLAERLREFFNFTINPWRFSAIGLATAWVIFFASSLVLKQAGHEAGFPQLNRNAFVKVQALNESGSVLGEQQGVVVGSEGLIASNLSHLAGASRLRITLKDGSSREISQIWKDEDKNLAVLKTDAAALTSIPLGDIKEIVGKKIYAVADFAVSGITINEAVASDIMELPSHRKEGGGKFIQVATHSDTVFKGAIVDEKGYLLGVLITEEKHINLATPARDVAQLVKTSRAISVGELKNISFSGDALNAYMKGILARDSQRWDEAVSNLQTAIRLNPRLEGAYVELGYAFYRKQNFSKEAEAYEAALKINPDNPDALYSLAWNMESRGSYQQAIPLYEKALALAPEDTEIIYQLGLSYLAQGKKDKASEMSRRLKRLDPGQAELLRRLIR
jgi:tetratricopeptide (TPR) repeat protein